jgi:hypothetical protein
MMTEELTSNTLVSKMAKKHKVLTLEVSLEISAEFQAAAQILGARSYATLLNQHVVQDIRRAKELVSSDEFERLKKEKIELIEHRSEAKSLERKKSVEKLSGGNAPTIGDIRKKKESSSKK